MAPHDLQIRLPPGWRRAGFRALVALLASTAAARAQAPPQSLLPATPPAAVAPAVPGAGSPALGPPAPAVVVRGGDHGTYERLVFDWPRAVGYLVTRNGDRALITFDRPARIDAAALRRELPGDIALDSVATGARSTVVTLRLPPGAELHASTAGARVVADVVRAPPGQRRTAAAPMPKTVAEVKPATKSPAAAPAPAASGAPAATPAAAVPATSPAPTATYSLSFSWDRPVTAALFRRAGYLWLVFDHKQAFDLNLVRREGGDALASIQQIDNQAATEIRMILDPAYQASLRQEGLLWIIDLAARTMPPLANPIAVHMPVATPDGPGIGFDVANPGPQIAVADPEVGDSMLVIPTPTLGSGVVTARTSPAVDVLATSQGIALVPHVDDLTIQASREGVVVTEPTGLPLSSLVAAQPVPGAAAGALFDVPTWQRGGIATFAADLATVRGELVAGLRTNNPAPAFMGAAEFFFANDAGPDCVGALADAAHYQPDIAKTPRFLAIRGACNTLMGRWDLALPDLDDPSLANDPEVQFWRAAAHAGASDSPGDWDKGLAAGVAVLHDYPKPLNYEVSVLLARAALAAGDDQMAETAVAQLQKVAETADEQDWVHYVTGAYDELANKFDDALTQYQAAIAGNNREAFARASLAYANLRLQLHQITAADAAKSLDLLRFAWRDRDFEFPLLRRLGELQAQAGDFGGALRTWRDLTTVYPDYPPTQSVIGEMHDLFNKLYLGGGADVMSPVAAIGLYDEFRDLTPPGAEGDEMIRKLADRLSKVDLLDRAAALLQYQVSSRLQGVDKARVGGRLALIDLLDKQPQAALDALTASDVAGEPDELQASRRHLRALALAELGHVADAVQVLANDPTLEAGELRGEIYFGAKDWPDAAQAYSQIVPPPPRTGPMDASQAQLLLRWATALSLAQDPRGLAAINRQYSNAMKGSTYEAAFQLLTGPPDKTVTDLPGALAKVKEVQGFATFLANYKEQVQAGALSLIN